MSGGGDRPRDGVRFQLNTLTTDEIVHFVALQVALKWNGRSAARVDVIKTVLPPAGTLF